VTEQHIARSYDQELDRLDKLLTQMGGMVEAQLSDAIAALMKRDSALAETVIAGDVRVDGLNREVDEFVVRLLALRQPMAKDLRAIVAALRISADLERIGDYAKNVAKRTMALNQVPAVRLASSIPRMGKLVQQIIKDVLDAYIERDADKAHAAWSRDEEVDGMYNSLFRELLTYMMEDPRNITPCTHILFIAKNIERMGDHATNIAETIYFVVHGVPMLETRPKGDTTSFTVLDPLTGSANAIDKATP
jgi:phosphate transport system protein